MAAELSDSELDCIGGDPAILMQTLGGPGTAPESEPGRMLGCLEDETLTRLFLAGFLPGPAPLSLEASACIRQAFGVIDPRAVMTAGLEGDPGKAMAGAIAAMAVTIACRNDEDWEQVPKEMVIGSQDAAAFRCIMDELGGPAQLAEAVMAKQTVQFTAYKTVEEALTAAKEADDTLDAATEACEMKTTPGTGQATRKPAPTQPPDRQ